MTYETTPENIGTEIKELSNELTRLEAFNSKNPSLDGTKAQQIGLELKATLERAEQLTLLYHYHKQRMEA